MGRVELHPSLARDRGSEPLVRYEKQLSVASIGTLWLGRLLAGHDAGRSVLLRQISRHVIAKKEFESIHKGASAYGKVRHPAFVKLLGVVEQDSDLVTVSEHLVGAPLMDMLRQTFDEGTPLPATVALRIILDSAKATIKAHRLSAEAGLFPTKRLFLPEGVFIASFGGTLLTEVGTLSAIANCAAAKTIPDLLVQLAPEEVAGGPTQRGSPEVFSLGVLLWECLANRWLFSRDNEPTAKAELATRPIPSLDTVERFGMPVPEALVDLVKTATERNPTRRFDSVNSFVTAIEQLPAHFVATEHQVAEALRQHANGFVARCTIEDSQLSLSGTFSEAPQSTVPTLPPAAGAFDTVEPPTFAQRKLISLANAEPPEQEETVTPEAQPSPFDNATSGVMTAPIPATTASPAQPVDTTRTSTATTPALSRLYERESTRRTYDWRVALTKRHVLLGLSLVVLVVFAFASYYGARATVLRPILPPRTDQAVRTNTLSEPTTNTPTAVEPANSDAKRSLTALDADARTTATSTAAPRPLQVKPVKTTKAYRPQQIAPYRPKGI